MQDLGVFLILKLRVHGGQLGKFKTYLALANLYYKLNQICLSYKL